MESPLARLPHPRRVRVVAFAVLPVCIAAFVAGASLGGSTALLVRLLAFQIPVGLALGGAIVAWRRVPRRTPDASFWGYLALALLFLFFSEAYFSGIQLLIDRAGPPSPSLFDALNLAATLAMLLLLASFLRVTLTGRIVRFRAGTGMAAAAAIAYACLFALSSFFARSSVHTPAEVAIWGLYSLTGLAVVVFACTFAFVRPRSEWPSWEKLAGVAIGGYGLATLLWPVWHVGGSSSADLWPGVLLSVAYMVGYHLLFMAGVYRLTETVPVWSPALPPAHARSRTKLGLAGSLGALLSIPVLGWVFLRSPEGSTAQDVYLAVAAIVTAAMVARTAIGDWESRALRDSAATDALTGVLNRFSFARVLQDEVERGLRAGEPVSLAVFDVDDFARFNVLRGREAGDSALSVVAGALGAQAPSESIVARLGGDEFAVVMPGSDKHDAARLAVELCTEAIETASGSGFSLTISSGVAVLPQDAESVSDLLRHADEALYWAKYQGKNRVAPFDSEVARALTVEERIRGLAERSRSDIVRALAAATDARDPATSYHSRQVALLSSLVCEAIGIEQDHARNVQLAALLHDVGKVVVPDSVLRKRARLSDGERMLLQEHARLGARILEATELAFMAPWVQAHHERWDGAGYPEGLSGEDTPLEARIIGVCNAYDLMVSGSPERGPLSQAAAMQELDHGIGTAFDPRLAEVLIDAIGRGRVSDWTGVWT